MKKAQQFTIIVGILGGILTGCSSAPNKGSPEYIREQVFQCRSLCANAEVNIAKIEGLDCVCSKPQQPLIYNPIVTGAAGGYSSPVGEMRSPASVSVPVTISPAAAQHELQPKDNASKAQDATGRTIISQTN